MESGSSAQEAYVQSPVQHQAQPPQEDYTILSPTLADILNDDRILRFYQCVKDVKTQNEPKQTAAMFFALCHALGDTVSFLKVPHMSKIMFRQEQQIFFVNVAGTQQDTPIFQNHATTTNLNQDPLQHPIQLDQLKITGNTAGLIHDVGSPHTSNLFSADATDGSPQHLLQAALASVTSHVEQQQSLVASSGGRVMSTTSKRKLYENKDGTTKRTKKASPRDKEYAVRRNEVIQDLLKVSEADLMHQANTVEEDTKLIIQGHEKLTKIGMLSPLHRFSAIANLQSHLDCDYAPKNSGVYFNFEYFQLYLAYRDLEAERQQQLQMEGADPRPVLAQVRNDIEKVLVNTNWEAIRRRLTIGERICQVCGIVGRGFLLLSKQVSGRKLLHNFNTGEWGEFMREFHKPENQPLLQTLQAKYLPERFYGVRQELTMVSPSHHDLSQTNSLVESMVKPDIMASPSHQQPQDHHHQQQDHHHQPQDHHQQQQQDHQQQQDQQQHQHHQQHHQQQDHQQDHQQHQQHHQLHQQQQQIEQIHTPDTTHTITEVNTPLSTSTPLGDAFNTHTNPHTPVNETVALELSNITANDINLSETPTESLNHVAPTESPDDDSVAAVAAAVAAVVGSSNPATPTTDQPQP